MPWVVLVCGTRQVLFVEPNSFSPLLLAHKNSINRSVKVKADRCTRAYVLEFSVVARKKRLGQDREDVPRGVDSAHFATSYQEGSRAGERDPRPNPMGHPRPPSQWLLARLFLFVFVKIDFISCQQRLPTKNTVYRSST